MKVITLLYMFFCIPKLVAQNATVASGGNFTGSGGSISYSIGQVFYLSPASSTGSTNQGVQQPFEISTLGVDEFPEIQVRMVVYPNPTSSTVTVSIQDYISENLSIQLFDINGKIVQSQKISQTETQISIENLSSASYLLQVLDNSKPIKTFKIIKNN